MKTAWHVALPVTLVLLGAPLLGVGLAGEGLAPYLTLPPQSVGAPPRVPSVPFSWPLFIATASFCVVAVAPFVRRWLRAPRGGPQGRPAARFPGWGWLGLAGGALAWVVAWSRFGWYAPLQHHTFTPLWLAYIVTVNALTMRRKGTCMMTSRPGSFLALFAASAGFWWFFEYLNRFVRNWYYVSIEGMGALEYFVYATLPFATVLPAFVGTRELLMTFPFFRDGLRGFPAIRVRRPRLVALLVVTSSALCLAGLGLWREVLFPLVWIAPLLLLVGFQAIAQGPHVFGPPARGDWTVVWSSAIAALVCGVFWEMWNVNSLAGWRYDIPFVHRFLVFEMPALGYFGYLPFGVQCAAVGALVLGEEPPSHGPES